MTTPSGALLREKAGFTRADGTRGDIFEAIFETTPLDTLDRGDDLPRTEKAKAAKEFNFIAGSWRETMVAQIAA